MSRIPKETKLEHALDLYRRGKITLMKASEIAGISLWEILDIVRERKVPMHYTLEDSEKDIESVHENNFSGLLKHSERAAKKLWGSRKDDVWNKV